MKSSYRPTIPMDNIVRSMAMGAGCATLAGLGPIKAAFMPWIFLSVSIVGFIVIEGLSIASRKRPPIQIGYQYKDQSKTSARAE